MPLDLTDATVEVIRSEKSGRVEVLIADPPARRDRSGKAVAVTMTYDEARMLVRYIVRRLKVIEGR